MLVLRLLLFALPWHISLFAQDTLKINVHQADSLLVARNLSLIASHYNVDKAEAAIIQAKLFDNPELSTEWNLHNPEKGQWFDVGSKGQKIFALEQVFRIAGQRNTSIKLAQEQKRMTEYQYQQLVRSLKYELHTSFYRFHFLNNAIMNITSQLTLLKNLIDVYGEQYRRGNISLQELTRLNTTYFTINSQVKEVQQELAALQETLRILLVDDRYIFPLAEEFGAVDLGNQNFDALLERALDSRPELKIYQSIETQQQLQYKLARKEAVPDLAAGVLYDQSGSYINNYTAATLGLKIPVFNRNQGQIQATKIGIKQSQVLLQSAREQIKAEVRTAWNVLQILLDQFNAVGPEYEQELDLLSEGLVNNYSKNNISLLEFTDLFEAYNTNIIQYNQLKADLKRSYEELVYALGG